MRRNLNQIQPCARGMLKGVAQRDNAQLRSPFVNNPDRGNLYLTIDS